ncbi:hypothetical protein ACFY36_31975 [Actinoplanes sp. NPDC000266]
MIVDVRRGVSLGVAAERARVIVPGPAPGAPFEPRKLFLQGWATFELALWCGTCPALFTKLAEPEAADLELANDRLDAGLQRIDDDVLAVYGTVLPESEYTVLLLDIRPQLVEPGDRSDYFAHEQVTTWGVDPVLGGPEDPGTPYYRTFETPLGNDRHLYEFVVPMVPPAWNDSHRVAEYAAVSAGEHPTAVAYSILDVLQPATDPGDDYYAHWVVSHFLLDGHHKVEAAATTGRPVRLLTFLDERTSLAAGDDVATMLQSRARSRQARTAPD